MMPSPTGIYLFSCFPYLASSMDQTTSECNIHYFDVLYCLHGTEVKLLGWANIFSSSSFGPACFLDGGHYVAIVVGGRGST